MEQAFLLDTCVLSETSKRRPHPAVIDFIATSANLVIPIAAIMEFQVGITELCGRDPVKASQLTNWYQKLISSGLPILDTTKEIAETWGTLAADPRLKNLLVPRHDAKRPRTGQDLHIAAASLVTRIPIATFNVRDFVFINTCYPLPGLYNPLDNKWHQKNENSLVSAAMP